MRSVVAALGPLALSAAILVPVGIAGAAVSPSASAAASESAEPSGSVLPDAHIELVRSTELDPTRTWAITVAGGSPGVDKLTIEGSAMSAGFSVTVLGPFATVEMTAELPAGWELGGVCFDFNNQVQVEALVPPRMLVLEVVQGGEYDCTYGSTSENSPSPTLPPTDSQPPSPSQPSGSTPMLLAVMALALIASVLIAVRAHGIVPGPAKRRQ